ncbi:hypothetical protein NP233_g6630 [Leucocoprinus birnbaumii]|uniref:Uncharacterized protein n=1 Tax=Leucocoprinus birnbaumii TaxID=56174 RepID=A0AAD5VQU4_9AGAR|nr:hypothetical protein NP233_g6630 [Leucocoprinus birnbaumii]
MHANTIFYCPKELFKVPTRKKSSFNQGLKYSSTDTPTTSDALPETTSPIPMLYTNTAIIRLSVRRQTHP